MHKHIPTSLFFVFILAAALIIFVFAVSLSNDSTDIYYNSSPEVGDEIIVQFPSWVPKGLAKQAFHLEPATYGQLVWLEEYNELHFIPYLGFHPSQTYQAKITLAPLFARLLPLSDKPSSQNKFTRLLPITKTLIFKTKTKIKEKILSKLTISKGKYIDINLKTMLLTLFQNKRAVGMFPIAGKGNPLTSPTVEGRFSVLKKEKNHFSRISRVWMPWSIQFFGNYFIHEWPYWPNGIKISSKFSAGCIRLYKKDSKKLYDWAEIGTPIIIHSVPQDVSLSRTKGN